MAISNTASPSGAQVYADGANPRIFTGVATEDIIAGGLVQSSPAVTQAVGSVISTIKPTDFEMLYAQDSAHVNGIALATVSSGTNAFIPVATRGTYILRAAGVISGGQGIVAFSGTSQGVKGASTSISFSGASIGRSLTTSASGTNLYVLANLNL